MGVILRVWGNGGRRTKLGHAKCPDMGSLGRDSASTVVVHEVSQEGL